eukprot:2800749-Rhodomonas_salina.1
MLLVSYDGPMQAERGRFAQAAKGTNQESERKMGTRMRVIQNSWRSTTWTRPHFRVSRPVWIRHHHDTVPDAEYLEQEHATKSASWETCSVTSERSGLDLREVPLAGDDAHHPEHGASGSDAAEKADRGEGAAVPVQ